LTTARSHSDTRLDFVEFRSRVDSFIESTNKVLGEHAVSINESRFSTAKDQRWIISAILAFVVPVLSLAYVAGQYPKRDEIISIVVDRTTDVEHGSEMEIRRVESILRADIKRIEVQINGLEKQLRAIRVAQRRRRR